MRGKGNTSLEMTIDHDISVPKIRTPQPPFIKIFSGIFKESHMLTSIMFETMRPFPRFVRVLLLFTEIYIQLFLSCIFVCLWGSYKGIDFISLWVVFLSQVMTTLIGNITRTSSRPLEKAKDTQEFIAVTQRVERKIKIRWFLIVFVCLMIIVFSCMYTVMFFAKSSESQQKNAFIIIFVSIFLDLAFFQVIESFSITCVKFLSYKSRAMKKLNGFLKKARVWKSTNPDLDN
ncbi:hypothetical protein SteCoe_31507 [Stentor coeruleus]|uniref:Uncharacterized protein n=1 Tax=Stentor coeruleus TaxID=5963 RepID=A0A1R2B1L6_9CILI|nr:hypothetical protein SteCoe_31507 [Stentor coeruleus]